MSNFNSNFKKISDSAGIVIAIAILEKNLPTNFWGSLSFDQLVSIYRGAYDYPQIKAQALDQLKKASGNFQQWYSVNVTYGLNNDLDQLVFERLVDLAQNFDDLGNAMFRHLNLKKDPDILQIIEKKMFDYAQTFQDWHHVYIYSENSKTKKIALQKMIELGKKSDELIVINYIQPTPETLNSTITKIELDVGTPLVKWGNVFQKLSISPQLRTFALQKISELSN